MKAPVVTIGGFAKRILNGKMGKVTSEQEEGLRVILRSCERLEHDLKLVLQHMKVELAERLSMAVFDIVEFTERILENLKSEADEKHIFLDFQEPNSNINIEADPSHIEKAFFNLIDNAIRYSNEDGSVRVMLSTH